MESLENNVQVTEHQEGAEQTERTGADQENREEVKTFTQEEVNKIVEKRLNRERQKFASVLHEGDPREAALSEREQAVIEKELRVDAKEIFRKEKLPEEALELLNYTDKESCDQSIELVRKVFKANVDAEVGKRLRGGTPPKRVPDEQPDLTIRGAFGLR